ncbi:SDR family oxidoreductase [Sphingobacterium oryzagri]|uniref:SDR family oxidoreductase n=1 Tax=Sphingobacterium oryzagri TaxID=3025669 RepID=A0ABY7WHA6_9SPHI|nr:SDR family oxidoreductase [Sphingobacterium sp. KACC 22765]WDF66779.1 SDR family oxidoreductase [Sphingobacterium sp. KACC 22765]
MSRRQALKGLGTTVATLVVAPSIAAETKNVSEGNNPVLENPLDKYPKPPYPKQKQPHPGLASKMDPLPDHGEKTYKGSGRLLGRKALITGGDSGIGRAAAIAYAREGADVAINYLPAEEEDAKEVVALIKEAGRKAVAIPGDITDKDFCVTLIEKTVSELGGLDLLVNNAGYQKSNLSILDIHDDTFDATIKTNIYAPFWITKAALPHLPAGASIIATTSVQAYDPSENLFDYAQTKAANVAYVKSLAKQLGPKGIRVNGVAPGPVWTALQVCGGQEQDKLENFGGDSPLQRAGQPAELASIFVQLADNGASFSTGQIYGAAGGGGHP